MVATGFEKVFEFNEKSGNYVCKEPQRDIFDRDPDSTATYRITVYPARATRADTGDRVMSLAIITYSGLRHHSVTIERIAYNRSLKCHGDTGEFRFG